MAAPFSAIMIVGALVLAVVTVGMMDGPTLFFFFDGK
jgi:hypothetical protein